MRASSSTAKDSSPIRANRDGWRACSIFWDCEMSSTARAIFLASAFVLLGSVATSRAYALTGGARIKDIARVEGSRTHALVGYGIVSGLAGTGDSPGNRATKQTLSNLLVQFNLTLPPDAILS